MFVGVSEAAGRVRLAGGWASTGSVPRVFSAATVTGEVLSSQGAVSTPEATCSGARAAASPSSAATLITTPASRPPTSSSDLRPDLRTAHPRPPAASPQPLLSPDP